MDKKLGEGIVEERNRSLFNGSKIFCLDYLYGIGGYQSRDLYPNIKYRFKIIVASENAKSVSKDFELFWTGRWEDDPEKMFKEVSIKPIN